MKFQYMNKIYSKEELSFIKDKFEKKYTIAEIAQAFNKQFNRNISKPNMSYALRFLGLRYHHFRKQTFKIGNMNRWKVKRDIGTERLDKDGYILVKVGFPRIEKRKHILVWEKEYGKINNRIEAIVFLDGDKTNCELSNLYKIDRRILPLYAKIVSQKDLTPDMRKLAIETANLYLKATYKERQRMRLKKEELTKKIFNLSKEGKNRKEIGKIVGLSAGVVSYHLKNARSMWEEYCEKERNII